VVSLFPVKFNVIDYRSLLNKKHLHGFIVDMEDVTYEGKPIPFVPRRDYGLWDLDRPSFLDTSEPDDPMIPDNYDPCPDDDALYALAARTRRRERGSAQ